MDPEQAEREATEQPDHEQAQNEGTRHDVNDHRETECEKPEHQRTEQSSVEERGPQPCKNKFKSRQIAVKSTTPRIPGLVIGRMVCFKCHRVFYKKAAYREHRSGCINKSNRNDESTKSNDCLVGGGSGKDEPFRAPQKEILAKHGESHERERACHVCIKVRTPDVLKRHKKEVHESDTKSSTPPESVNYSVIQRNGGPSRWLYKCHDCSVVIKSKGAMISHIRAHKNPNGVTCLICRQPVAKKCMIRHMELKHRGNNVLHQKPTFKSVSNSSLTKSSGFKGRVGMLSESLKDYKIETGEFKCAHCKYVTKLPHNFKRHLETTIHLKRKSYSSKEGVYKCNLCSYRTPVAHFFTHHLGTTKHKSNLASKCKSAMSPELSVELSPLDTSVINPGENSSLESGGKLSRTSDVNIATTGNKLINQSGHESVKRMAFEKSQGEDNLSESKVKGALESVKKTAFLVSDFRDFSKKPYACAFCFFRTGDLEDLNSHVGNHIKDGQRVRTGELTNIEQVAVPSVRRPSHNTGSVICRKVNAIPVVRVERLCPASANSQLGHVGKSLKKSGIENNLAVKRDVKDDRGQTQVLAASSGKSSLESNQFRRSSDQPPILSPQCSPRALHSGSDWRSLTTPLSYRPAFQGPSVPCTQDPPVSVSLPYCLSEHSSNSTPLQRQSPVCAEVSACKKYRPYTEASSLVPKTGSSKLLPTQDLLDRGVDYHKNVANVDPFQCLYCRFSCANFAGLISHFDVQHLDIVHCKRILTQARAESMQQK